MIKYISLFSGIEAAKVAFDLAEIEAVPLAFFEIEKQQSKLLAQKYPDTPNYGDVCKFDFSVFKGKIDFLCGGSPCQSFSMANQINRDGSGIDLMKEYVRAVKESEPDYFLFENVPQAENSFRNLVFPSLFDFSDNNNETFLSHKYNIHGIIINSSDFGFMQPRKRFYATGSKKGLPYKTPYAKRVCNEQIIFNYLPPTNYDLRHFEKHKEKYAEKKVYAYSLCPREFSKASVNIPTITRKHPIIEISCKPQYFYSRTQQEFRSGKRDKIPVLVSKPIIEQTETSCAILSAETHEQLQGFPIGYTSGFSFSRRIAMLGNSWHCGTIAEIFKQMFKE